MSTVGIVLVAVALIAGSAAAAPTSRAHATSGGARVGSVTAPGAPYKCAPGGNDSIYGQFGDAAAIGWQGNHQGVVACLGGSFYVQDGINATYGFGIYNNTKTMWTNVDGYLPALVTSFHRSGTDVSITNFADELTLGGAAYVAVYSRVAVHNPTSQVVDTDPQASPGLIPLVAAPTTVSPGATVNHDYVIAVDRFGQQVPWPSASALAAAGDFDAHLAHMRDFWNGRLASIAQITVPDGQLNNAYRSGFISTQIARSGNRLDTGVNNYEDEYSHDVIGILANLFTQGDFTDAQALLLRARDVVGLSIEYEDGLWGYSWPWAIYLMKTGDLSFVKANFATEGPGGSHSPSIEDAAHKIAADRFPANGVMHVTVDIDSLGHWTIDDYEALMGLAAYRYIAQRVGNTSEVAWATQQYDSLLAATDAALEKTIKRYHLHYLPCSVDAPNTANRCGNARDANWAAPFLFGRWAWDAPLFGAKVSGPGVSLIDSTYDYGFNRLKGKLPPNTLGGYPGAYYSSGYNAGYGSWGLASAHHRDQGILGYQFMISHTQSGPYSWWESVTAPNPKSPWVGSHPGTGHGSSPHAWGIANANKVLLDSLVAQRSDGALIVGRGVPNDWVRTSKKISVANFPTVDGHRLDVTITTHGQTVSLTFTGDAPAGKVLFQLPAFVHNLAHSSRGSINNQTGTVTLPPNATHVTVKLTHPV